MWRKIFKSTDWSFLVELVSPRTFEVMPLGNARHQFTDLASNYLKKARFAQTVEARRQLMEESDVEVKLLGPNDVLTGDPTSIRTDGQQLLELYFHQIYAGKSTILDLRHSQCRRTIDGLIWQPNRFYIKWQPQFCRAFEGSMPASTPTMTPPFVLPCERSTSKLPKTAFANSSAPTDNIRSPSNSPTSARPSRRSFTNVRRPGLNFIRTSSALGFIWRRSTSTLR